ncbi:MAG TPA: hypothetical protein PK762_13290 [Candidatus Kapabacteria bacterium]|nr:hypothetical protein [Candidatus Kapabacteria bacterium]
MKKNSIIRLERCFNLIMNQNKLEILKIKSFKSFCALLLFLSFIFSINSCKTVKAPCPEKPEFGSLGSLINTEYDDYLPVIIDSALYYISIIGDKEDREQMFSANIFIDSVPKANYIFDIDKLYGVTTPSVFYDIYKNQKEYYFSAYPDKRRKNSDIYCVTEKDGEFSKPIRLINTINTEFYESHPTISKDGQVMIFTSDRTGSTGETDFYISHKNEKGEWTEAQNMGTVINTTSRELTPFLLDENTLFFASNGQKENKQFDIYKARLENYQVNSIRPLTFPINTSFDETGPFIFNEKIFLASNRSGGCGAFDIYAFDLCGAAKIQGKVIAKNPIFLTTGKIKLFKNSSLISEKFVDDEGKFEFTANPNTDYLLSYSSPCFSDKVFEQRIYSPCSDSSFVVLVTDIELPSEKNEFFFEEYKVPFFVTGYYLPNTKDNLNILRKKFENIEFGSDERTRYIENPGFQYEQYIETIDKAISDAIAFILSKLRYLENPCSKGTERINITISGYADPRGISENAVYSELPINDSELSFKVDLSEKMTNDLLSQLRAYFTAKHLQKELDKNKRYSVNKNKIKWNIKGYGIDTSENITDIYKRRVIIEIMIND